MCILLYVALARGPIAVVAPIVAAHPALVLLVNVLAGVRPSALQWAAMVSHPRAAASLITRSAASETEPRRCREKPGHAADRHWRVRSLMPRIFLTAQVATPLIGALETMWIGRWTGLALHCLDPARRKASGRACRPTWLPFVSLQGGPRRGGLFHAARRRQQSPPPHITMIVASGFSVVTVLLARIVIHEPVSKTQWAAIALIAAGTAVLTAT